VRVLHLPTSVGQNAWNLAQGEKSLGVDSTVLVYDAPYMGYPADRRVNVDDSGTAAGKLVRLAREFIAVRGKYDVFHFNWGTSLVTSRSSNLHHLDLPFYPRSAKLFATYNGCDARQKYPTIARGGVSACRECGNAQCASGKLDESRAAGIAKMAAHVEHIWALNPDLLHFLPRGQASFLPYAVATPGLAPQWPSVEGPLRLVHAPTNRDIKGTAHLLAAVDRLNQKRPGCIDLVMVEGMNHQQALQVYRTADVVADQLLVGWYGAFAVEAMLLGKPVIARIAEADLRFVPPEMASDLGAAVINADPDSIEEVLARCLDSRPGLVATAKAGYAYARTWHDPQSVACITVASYTAALA
jgi:hypothetical protein